ncbi:protein of unknown function [Thermococcus nautili]|nr:protein of unknown function [Thermococcus nautili]
MHGLGRNLLFGNARNDFTLTGMGEFNISNAHLIAGNDGNAL